MVTPGGASRPTVDGLSASGEVLARLGRTMTVRRNGALSANATSQAFQVADSLLRLVERQLVDPAGLPGRPFLRHQVFAADRDNGYANVQFPAIVVALRDHDTPRAAAATAGLAERVRSAAALVERATAAMPPVR